MAPEQINKINVTFREGASAIQEVK